MSLLEVHSKLTFQLNKSHQQRCRLLRFTASCITCHTVILGWNSAQPNKHWVMLARTVQGSHRAGLASTAVFPQGTVVELSPTPEQVFTRLPVFILYSY